MKMVCLWSVVKSQFSLPPGDFIQKFHTFVGDWVIKTMSPIHFLFSFLFMKYIQFMENVTGYGQAFLFHSPNTISLLSINNKGCQLME